MDYRLSTSFAELMVARAQLGDLDRFYPDFDNWFVNQVVPGVLLHRDPFVVAEDAGSLVGLAIARGGDRPKLRCIRVSEPYRGRGVGLHLLDRVLAAVDCDKPEVTVAEEMMATWAPILTNRYDFDLTVVHKGLYRRGKVEYAYNAPKGKSIPTPYGR